MTDRTQIESMKQKVIGKSMETQPLLQKMVESSRIHPTFFAAKMLVTIV